jgi:hypothetical protein
MGKNWITRPNPDDEQVIAKSRPSRAGVVNPAGGR